MQFSGPAFLLTLILATGFLQSCSSPTANSTNTASPGANTANSSYVPKDNVGELLIHVRLPYVPEEVTWEENQSNKSLVAAIRLTPDEAEKMLAEASKLGQPTNETLTVESWFPAELRAQGELSGESTVKGQTYPADSLLNPPYTKGKLTHVENTDYFILHASS